MSLLIIVSCMVIPVILIILIFKNKQLVNILGFLDKLFWVDKFKEKKMLLFGARFFQIAYIYTISYFLLDAIIQFDLQILLNLLVFTVIFPIMYRIIMGFQRLIHRI